MRNVARVPCGHLKMLGRACKPRYNGREMIGGEIRVKEFVQDWLVNILCILPHVNTRLKAEDFDIQTSPRHTLYSDCFTVL